LRHVPARQRRARGRLGDVSGIPGRVPERLPGHLCVVALGQARLLPNCGTQISFAADYIPGLIDLTIGRPDHPEKVAPTLHYWEARRLPWVHLADDLPRYPEFPPVE
jgi:hypothetical protein